MARTNKDGDKKSDKDKKDSAGGASRGSDVFDSSPRKDMFGVPPTGGLFDSAGDETASPFEVNVDVFQPEDSDIDQAMDGVFTSATKDVLASDAGAKSGTGEGGVGARKETSILFSLGNLHSLANEPEDAEAIGASAPSASGNKEMSGLIDIRTLKDAFVEEKEDHVDDLLSVGSEAFSPILTFQARGMSQRTKITIIGGSVALVIALVVFFIFALSGGEEEEVVNEQIAALQQQIDDLRSKGGGSTDQVAALEAKLAKAMEKEEAESSESEQAASSDEEKGDAKSIDRKKDGSSKNYKLKSKDAPSGADSEEEKSEPSTEPKKTSKDLEDLLGGSGSTGYSGKKKSGSSSSSSGGAKKSLDRSDVQKGLGAVAGKVKACGNGTGGFVTLKVVIGANGSVLTAQPTGAHSGTSVGTCAAKAVKTAKFPKTQSSTTVSYPFKL